MKLLIISALLLGLQVPATAEFVPSNNGGPDSTNGTGGRVTTTNHPDQPTDKRGGSR